MAGNGCPCANKPEIPSEPAATPCGSRAQHTDVVWETLVLNGNATQVSRAIPTRGANAFALIIMTISGAGAIQTAFQAQATNDGVNFTNIGSPGQATGVGYTTMGPITGNGFTHIRLVAVEQAGNATLFTVVAQFYCG